MKATYSKSLEQQTDESLVQLTLAGNHEAFGGIVERYQGSVCGLAYSACGDLSRSEDIGQDVFIAAFEGLRKLNDLTKFKAWLFGIARNVIRNRLRSSTRNPLKETEPLTGDDQVAEAATHPVEQAISNEEAAILWQVLSALPEIYRQPMVLYYRENQSIQAVAEALGISDELARPRLSRGRALLSERVEQVLKQGLRRLRPSDGFTVTVLAALPVAAMATTAKGAVMGAAAMKGAPAQGGGALAGLKGIGLFAGILALPAGLGSLFGLILGRDTFGRVAQRRAAAKFWRLLGLGLLLLVLLPLVLSLSCAGFLHGETRTAFLKAMTFWLGLAYWFVPVALGFWLWQRRKTAASEAVVAPSPARMTDAIGRRGRNPLYRRLALFAAAGASGLLIFCYHDMYHNLLHLKPSELRDYIGRVDPARVTFIESENQYRSLFKTSPETFRTFYIQDTTSGKRVDYVASAESDTEQLLAARGIPFRLIYEGRDFEVLGTPGRLLPLLAAFIVGLGVVFVWRTRRAETST